MLPILLLLACQGPDGANPGPTDDTTDSTDPADTPDDTTASDDTTDTTVPVETCGNGQLDVGEACDPSLTGGTTCGCLPDCTYAPATTACDDGDACTVADTCDGAGVCASAPMDCDDGDACTTDTCDAGACQNLQWSGDPQDLWDMALLTDPSTLNMRVINTEVVLEDLTPVRVQEIRYTSYESEGCELRPIELEAYVAIPSSLVGGRNVPGLAVAHGLGAFAEAGSASNPAAQLGAAVIAWSGPGQGLSQGTGSTPDHLFDVMRSPTDSWFWEHAVAAIRGLTLLQTLPEVDDSRLAMSGYSGGAVATHIVNGVDDRLVAAVPTSGTGHLDLAASNPATPGWELDILGAMIPPRDASSPEWVRFVASLDPLNYTRTAHAPVFLINGAQDEFFPIDATAATFADLQSTGLDHRLYSIINWDHGWFALFAGEQPAIDADRNFEYWMKHQLGVGGRFADLPPQPTFVDVIPGLCDGWICALAVVDLPPSAFDVVSAKVHFSVDGLAWFSADLERGALGWTGGIPLTDPNLYNRTTAAWIGEFELRSSLLGPNVKVSTAPSLPPGWRPRILPIAGPLPL